MIAISIHIHADTIIVNSPFEAYYPFFSGQQVYPNEYWLKDLTDVRLFLQQKGIPASVIFNGTGVLNRSFDRP
jgi:hypothetical protein